MSEMSSVNQPQAYIGDIDMSKVIFLPLKKGGSNQSIVEICKDNTSTTKNKLLFNLCTDIQTPCNLKYKLDSINENSDGSRRGHTVLLEDPQATSALEALDEMVIAAAITNSKDWFKKVMNETEIRFLYKSLVNTDDKDGITKSTKFKVKCESSQYPTKLHTMESGEEDDVVTIDGGCVDDLCIHATKVVPLLTAYCVWIGSNQFGVSMQAEQMVIQKGSDKPVLSGFTSKRPMSFKPRETNKSAKSEPDEGVETSM
jgi:hypothetical protein